MQLHGANSRVFRVLAAPRDTDCRRRVAWLGALVWVTLALTAIAQPTYVDGLRLKAQGKPNLILIVADDLGYGDLGSYGQKLVRTPNLDRLAADGVRFTEAYASGTHSVAAHESILTGRNTVHARLPANGSGSLRADEPTLAERLVVGGYTAAAIGRWGLGASGTPGQPRNKGFHEFLGSIELPNDHPYYPEFVWRNEVQFFLTNNISGRKGTYVPDFLTEAALRFIRDNRQRPFFLYLAYPTPRLNTELADRTGNGFEVPDDHPYGQQPWTPAQKNRAASITRLDADIGRILQRLKDLKLDADTVVIFTSDHGPQAGAGFDPTFFDSTGGLSGGHAGLQEGDLRVPLLAAWPGKFQPGTVQAEPVAAWDLAPTLAGLAKGAACTGDGQSFAPLLFGRTRTNQTSAFYWRAPGPDGAEALRSGDWKILRPNPNQPLQLFNLQTDPKEQHDVADANPAVASRMKTLLDEARPKRAPIAPVSPGSAAAETR